MYRFQFLLESDEKWKEPLLEIRIPEYNPLVSIEGMCHALVVNSPHKYLPIERSTAIDTKVEIRFYDANETPELELN